MPPADPHTTFRQRARNFPPTSGTLVTPSVRDRCLRHYLASQLRRLAQMLRRQAILSLDHWRQGFAVKV